MTILAGGNACGKSSVIQIIRYVNQLQKRQGRWYINTKLDNQDLGMARNLISSFIDAEGAPIIKVFASISNGEKLIDSNIELRAVSTDDYEFSVDGENLTKLPVMLNLYPLNADRRYPQTIHEIGDVSNWYVGSSGEHAISLFNYLNILSKDDKSKKYTINNLNDSLRFKDGKLIKRFDILCDMWMSNILGRTHIYASKIEDTPYNKLLFRNFAGDCVPAATGFGISYRAFYATER